MTYGICTLANDVVYDQLLALINSIRANQGDDISICVYPYDNQTERIAKEIAKLPKVELYDDRSSMDKWDSFARAVWDCHPTAKARWQKGGIQDYHRFGTHRRYCAFDGPFEKFIYMDADTVLLAPINDFLTKLDDYDCVVYDYQYKHPKHVYELASPKLLEIFSEQRIQEEIFCSGIYASKNNLFSSEQLIWLIEQLQSGEAEILYPSAPDQTILNYMMMRPNKSIYNYALNTPKEQRIGNCVTDPKFIEKDHLLFDKGYRLIFLHYIGLSSSLFRQVCAGENIDFPYRSIFLHYRYLNEPENYSQFTSKPRPYKRPPSLLEKAKGTIKNLLLNNDSN